MQLDLLSPQVGVHNTSLYSTLLTSGHVRKTYTESHGRSRTRDENRELLECYYKSKPRKRGWIVWNPTSRLTSKQLVAQWSNICRKQLLSQLKIDELQHKCYSKGELRMTDQRGDHPHTQKLAAKTLGITMEPKLLLKMFCSVPYIAHTNP